MVWGLAAVGFDTSETEVLAVRGERLGLMVSHRYAGEAKLDMLAIAEADTDGMATRSTSTTCHSSTRRWPTWTSATARSGCSSPSAAAHGRRCSRLLLALNAQDGAALGASIADDGALEDHRPNSWGTVDRDQWIGDLPGGLGALARRSMGPPPGARAHRVGRLLRSRDARHPRTAARTPPRSSSAWRSREGKVAPRPPLGARRPCGGRGLVQGAAADAGRPDVTAAEPGGRGGSRVAGSWPWPMTGRAYGSLLHPDVVLTDHRPWWGATGCRALTAWWTSSGRWWRPGASRAWSRTSSPCAASAMP